MKKGGRLLALTMAAVVCFSMAGCGKQEELTTKEDGESTEEAEETLGENMIQNGDFSDDLTNWVLYTEGGSAVQLVNSDGEMEIQVSSPGTKEHAIQPYYDGFSLETGCVYTFSFDVHATVERTIQWRLQLNGGDYHAYVSDLITINEEVQHVTCTFTMEETTDPAPRLCVNMGMLSGCPDDLGEHTVYFDNFELYLIDDSGRVSSESADETVDINVNQVGYLPDAEKEAVVRAELGTDITGSFDVVNVDTNEVVYTGDLEDSMENVASGEQTAIADFSELTEEGTYKVVTETYGESFEFEIRDTVYDDITTSAMRMFYLQRCGETVTDDTYGHDACHTGEAVVYGSSSDDTVSVNGGWHDAGDYGRYTVSGAKAAADLMLAYENYGTSFGDDTGIPESGNGIPDILDEVKYELDWMLTMQDSESGGVYHKVTCENFADTVMPEEETDQLILSPISTTATADFAATMAMAARIFGDMDADYAATCMAAAEQAWSYLEQTPNDGVGFQNPETISTGSYDDADDTDERYWALAELYKTTGNDSYLSALKEYDIDDIGGDLGWQDVGIYGMYAYLSCGDSKLFSDDYYQTVEDRFYELVDTAMEYAEEDAYGVAISSDGYCWGSNMHVANKGMLFLMANQLTPDDDYVEAARQQLNYLLGTNTTSYCFVTGFGTLSPEDPHHRPSQVVGEAMEGMLVGGPDSDLEDSYAQATLAGKANAACYVDNVQSYSCNEVTVYWNSPLVYLLTGVTQE